MNFMNQWDKVFWILFIVIGAIIVIGTLGNIFIFDILLGVAVIVIGTQKLAEDIKSSKLNDEQEKINENINNISHWMNSSNNYTKNLKNRHEYRFYYMDKKRIDTEKRIETLEEDMETMYNTLAKKLFEIENRLNEIFRVFVSRERVRSGRGK